jgi:S-adenosylmethionine:tRNA ribosyltransferase-isomerase
MKTRDFEYPLPPGLIAFEPAPERDASRLLVIKAGQGKKQGPAAFQHTGFRQFPSYLRAGDMLLLNETRVLPVRFVGRKKNSGGGKLEVLLVKKSNGKPSGGTNASSGECWDALWKGSYTGEISIGGGLKFELLDGKKARVLCGGDEMEAIRRAGMMPLPPYIKREPGEMDRERYQTVFAKAEGSIAAPTAGLHFTERILAEIQAKGVLVRRLVLHVGPGTFRPVKAVDVEGHNMDAEEFSFDETLPGEVRRTRESGGRVFAVGTTATRAIEGYFSGKCRLKPRAEGKIEGETDIFITPGYEFRAVDCLLTNFHLPCSTPLMLAAALCGRERLFAAYSEAAGLGYRFYSYGDVMLVC